MQKLSKESIDDYDNICLISNEPLEKEHITSCKHKFNYIPIFNEIKKKLKNIISFIENT